MNTKHRQKAKKETLKILYVAAIVIVALFVICQVMDTWVHEQVHKDVFTRVGCDSRIEISFSEVSTVPVDCWLTEEDKHWADLMNSINDSVSYNLAVFHIYFLLFFLVFVLFKLGGLG